MLCPTALHVALFRLQRNTHLMQQLLLLLSQIQFLLTSQQPDAFLFSLL